MSSFKKTWIVEEREDDGQVCVVYCDVMCCTVIRCTVLWCDVLYYTVLYCTEMWCYVMVVCCFVLCCTVVWCVVLWCLSSTFYHVSYFTSFCTFLKVYLSTSLILLRFFLCLYSFVTVLLLIFYSLNMCEKRFYL